MAHDDFQIREILEYVRVDEAEYRDRFFVDEEDGIGTAFRARPRPMNVRRHVELAKFFIQRVPVAVSERWRFRAAVFVRIGVQETADETQFHAALKLRNRILNWIPGGLRQGTHTDPFPGKKFHLARNDVVALFGEPVYQPRGLLRLHELKRSRRNQLDIRAVIPHVIEM